jgi:threonyl-tRNA synthetase
MVLNITDLQRNYAEDLVRQLTKVGIRVQIDLRNEKIGYKIREHTLAKVPYLLVVGDREVETQQVSVRQAGAKDQVVKGVDEFIDYLQTVIAEKRSARAEGENN